MNELFSQLPQKDGLIPNRLNVIMNCVEVPVEILNNTKKRIVDEITLFRVGLAVFFAALPLGVERLFTVVMATNGNKSDTTFWVCLACLFFGIFQIIFGYRHNRSTNEMIDIFTRYKK